MLYLIVTDVHLVQIWMYSSEDIRTADIIL